MFSLGALGLDFFKEKTPNHSHTGLQNSSPLVLLTNHRSPVARGARTNRSRSESFRVTVASSHRCPICFGGCGRTRHSPFQALIDENLPPSDPEMAVTQFLRASVSGNFSYARAGAARFRAPGADPERWAAPGVHQEHSVAAARPAQARGDARQNDPPRPAPPRETRQERASPPLRKLPESLRHAAGISGLRYQRQCARHSESKFLRSR